MRRRQPLLQTVWICQPFRRLASLIRTEHSTSEESAIQRRSPSVPTPASVVLQLPQCSGAAGGPCAPAVRSTCPAGCGSSPAPAACAAGRSTAACCSCCCRGLPAAPIPPIAVAASRSPAATQHSPPPAARLRQAGAALWGASPVPCGLRRAPRGVGTKPPRDDSQRTPIRRFNRPSTTFPSRYVLKAAVKGGDPTMQMSPQWMSAGSIPAPWVLTVRSTHLRHALGTLIHLSTAPEYQRGTWAVTQYELNTNFENAT